MTTPRPPRHRVLIIGGGFGGLYAARELRKAPVEVTLLDRRNHHLFSPLLYQVAMGALAPSEIAQPLRSILRKQRNARVLLGEAVDLDAENRSVRLADGTKLEYDTLIVSTGTHHAYFGHDEWADHTHGLKTLEDALEVRARVLDAFEQAELEPEPEQRRRWMRFVIVGAGPTGVELAGSLCEIAREALPSEFRAIDTSEAQVHLIEAAERVLPTYPESLSRAASRQLVSLGTTVDTDTRVVDAAERGVAIVAAPDDEPRWLDAGTVLWAAGVVVARFGRAVAAATDAPTDLAGRIEVTPELTVPGHPEIFVVGDLAAAAWTHDRMVPGVAQGAIQGGRYAARAISQRLDGDLSGEFHFKDLGELATIGRLRAVADFRRIRFSGIAAWLAWVLIHIFWLIGMQNRILVMTRWAWLFVTRSRGNRLITHPPVRSADPPGR